MKPAIYIETSVISYLTARPSRDLIVAAHQQLTDEWWDNVRPQVECFVSPFVIQEASRGDKGAAQKRMDAIAGLPILELNDEIRELAATYFAAINIPEKARIDAFHLAVAVWHKMDYLLSWNCTHIASGRVRKILGEVNDKLGIRTPVICTPEELMEV
ncbi:MAG TPA: type II toxin-antitoxin system VapC family toxin [Blastocatellia bacterium]|nr:type II toxin-antitoxin system VapC family toxin [Blastocatellia bacterium]